MTMPKRGAAPTWRWEPPEEHATLASTQTEVLLDPRVGRVVVADHQSAGQGRRGRTWSSPPGTGMAISAVLPAPGPAVLGWVPLVAGLAVRRALLDSRWTLTTALKWPNDVLVEQRGGEVEDGQIVDRSAEGCGRAGKLAGILAQVHGDVVVVGTGLNVDHDEATLPVPGATSWRLCRGGAVLPEEARGAFLQDYLRHLADLHDELVQGDPGVVRTAYRQACSTLGRPVLVHLPDGGTVEGTAVDVADDGALVVQGPGGRSVHHAGDVEHLRPRPRAGHPE